MAQNENQQTPERQFALQRIYTKDVSFETPNCPDVFRMEWKPEAKVSLNNEVQKLSDDLYEVVLTVTVTTSIGEKTAYLVEVKQAAIVGIQGFAEAEMGHMLSAYCPNLLFPYVREVVSDLVGKATFPQMLLSPVNFDALYQQHQQQAASAASAPDTVQ